MVGVQSGNQAFISRVLATVYILQSAEYNTAY